MKKGIVSRIMTDCGEAEELNVLCTFSYDGRKYLLGVDSEDDFVCREIRFNVWKGAYADTDPACDDAVRIGYLLLRNAEADEEYYAFRAEHYEVSDGADGLLVRKRGKLKLLNKSAKLIPLALRLFVALAFAAAYGLVCVHTSEITVAANVFSEVPRERLAALVYLIQISGAVLLFFIRSSKRGLIDFF